MADMSETQDDVMATAPIFQGASVCPSCANSGEFDLPDDTGSFEIACYDCAHIYEIDAHEAINLAAIHGATSPDTTTDTAPEIDDAKSAIAVQCLTCGNEISADEEALSSDDAMLACPHCHPEISLADDIAAEPAQDDIDLETPTRFSDATRLAPLPQKSASGKTGIILVSILSAGLVVTAAMVALGLYFLTLRTDSDVSRYIEANILQLAPAEFTVDQATYEVSETELGKSLLVTISVGNKGQVEGTPEEMKIVLVDAQNNPLVSWPLDTAGQIIAPGETTQLYTRLFEPPANFANLQVFVR